MSNRPGLRVTIRKPADGGASPNRYVPVITAEIRLHWPPKATADDIDAALSAAIDEARMALTRTRDRRNPEPPHTVIDTGHPPRTANH